MQRLRMPMSLTLVLAAACGGGQESAPPTSGANEPPPVSSSETSAKPSDTPVQMAAQSKATPSAGAAGTASAADVAKSGMSTAAPSSAAAAGSSAQSPDVPSPSGSAGAAAGSGGSPAGAAAGAAGGAAGAAGDAAPTAMPTEDGIDPLNPDWSKRTDLGKGDGSDVVTIGDSWMDYVGGGGGIQAGLDRAGMTYRHYALSGTTLLSGQIPSQYTQAKAVNKDIKTIIMTGGGNDVMFSGGCNTAELCEMSVAMIQGALQDLWTQMADDGVKDVIYIQYAEDAGTAPTGTRPKTTKPIPICLSGRILCHTVPTTDVVMGQLVDGIHPTLQANDRIAAVLVKMMEERKMRR